MRVCICVQPCHIKRFILLICVNFAFIAVTMCDLVHNVKTIVYHPGLIFQKKDFKVLLVTRTYDVQSPYYTLVGNAEQHLAKCHIKT